MARSIVYAGFKDLSLVDVVGCVCSTVWLCGCNLCCPFCHNWRIASRDPSVCRSVDIESIVEKLLSSKPFIDYVHVTGGEPLLQIDGLIELYSLLRSEGFRNSLDTNLTLPDQLGRVLEEGLLDHIAFDLKTPFRELSGLGENADRYWSGFIESLEILSQYSLVVEMRIVVAHKLTIECIRDVLSSIASVVKKIKNLYIVVNPLLGPPITSPRDNEWCRMYCNPSRDELSCIAGIARELTGARVYVKSTPLGNLV